MKWFLPPFQHKLLTCPSSENLTKLCLNCTQRISTSCDWQEEVLHLGECLPDCWGWLTGFPEEAKHSFRLHASLTVRAEEDIDGYGRVVALRFFFFFLKHVIESPLRKTYAEKNWNHNDHLHSFINLHWHHLLERTQATQTWSSCGISKATVAQHVSPF